jgi:hypothetical protein
MRAVTTDTWPPGAAAAELDSWHWRVVRTIQGFICWGGGSRRFIYGPQKLNPDVPTWVANKFQTAMPGHCSEPIT